VITPVVPEPVWIEVLRETPQWLPPRKTTIVIAPHPDDETLATAGFIASQRRLGIPVTVVAVTDGEAAYEGVQGLGKIREVEQEQALAELGVCKDEIIRLRLPDSDVTTHESRLADLLKDLFRPDSLIIAPWELDYHPDHEACGRAAWRAAKAVGCATPVSYLFWTWHRGDSPFVLQGPIRRFDLDDQLQAAKRAALACHRSQLQRDDGQPILPELLLKPAYRSFETFLIHE
jgi:LmbE family N-acetylglucosaminyl deacetylase